MLSIIGLIQLIYCLRRLQMPYCDLSLWHLDFKMEAGGIWRGIYPRALSTCINRNPSVSRRAPSGVRQSSCGGPPAIRRSPADVYVPWKYLDFCRYTYTKSDVWRSPADNRALIVRSFFDLNSIHSRARRLIKF
ncbi:hypothetical protein DPMN_087502 [Dreissena polymorpha]|uniref:Uncharacterized protein n=1 Tax=Dreissena polymorpha TaxID=45954 RepID=A0A9D4KSH6_DREPO|nr:hypothetical protein DPMN_087502 [Dreissena polymorpha]